MNILTLDLGQNTGWATKSSSGIWDVGLDRTQGFLNLFNSALEYDEIDHVFVVMPQGYKEGSIIHNDDLVQILKDTSLKITLIPIRELRKYVTGRATASKEFLEIKLRKLYPELELKGDKHVTAVLLYDMIKDTYADSCKE